MSEKEKEYKFSGKVVRCTYNTPDFKIFALDVDKQKYPDIKHTKYGNVSILGELHELTIGVDYDIVAIEQVSKYGISYKVLNIKRDVPTTQEDMQLFLQEILTPNQAKVLYENYPDIVQRVKENRLDDIDLNKLKGIKEYTFNVIKNKIIENFCLADLVIEFQGYLNLSIIKKIYNKYPSIESLKEKLKSDPYKCLCGLAGVGFKTADGLLLDMEKASKKNIAEGKKPIIEFETDLKSSPQRCLSCLLYLLNENETEGHTKMNLVDLRKECMQLVPTCSHHFVEVVKSPSIYYNKDTMDVALKRTYDLEHQISKTLLYGLNQKSNVWDYNTEKFRNVNGTTLSDEQMKIVENICKYNINILNGAAGCVDCDTEFFNGTEWKKMSDYIQGERVLQYNSDGTANLVNPLAYIKNKCNYLWEFSGRYGLDQCLSDNHNVVYTTKTLYNKDNKVKFIKFSELKDIHESGKRFYGKFITTFDYEGNGVNISDDELRLMVAIISDGCFVKNNKHRNCMVNVKKDRKKQRIEYLLKQNNIEYDTYISDKKSHEGYTTYRFYYDKLLSKKYPKYLYQCNKHQFQIIFDEIFYWDGNFNGYKQWYSSDVENVNFIQFVGTILGYKSSITKYDTRENSYIDGREIIRNEPTYTVYFAKRTLLGLNNDVRTPDKWTKFNKYRTKDGYEYCFTVPSHMLILRRNGNIFITGNCGKSFSTQAIINMLKEHKKSFKLFSPTGKAAKVLHDFTNESTTTIHRGLGWTPNGFIFNKNNKLKCDIVIVDEFSMVDIHLFNSLLEAIDFNTTKLLLIGDNAQLISVGCGNLLHDFMETDLIPTVTLTKVFRYGEGGLMKVATDVRFCKTYLNSSMKSQMTIFGDNKDYTFVDLASEAIPKTVVALYQKLLDMGNSIDNIQVLTAKNIGDCGTAVLNNMIQKVANPNYGSNDNMKVGETTYYKGDLIIQKVNNYKAEIDLNSLHEDERNFYNDIDETPTAFIANGETGVIKEIYNSYIIIDFDGICVKYYRNDMNMIGLGYSITIHKSQGSSIDNVILCTPQSHIFMLNSNILYVGLTRMRKKCFHLGTLTSVNQAVGKKANLTRHTFMQQLLLNMTESEYMDTEVLVESTENNYDNDSELPWYSNAELEKMGII